jgi:hypothetical protein
MQHFMGARSHVRAWKIPRLAASLKSSVIFPPCERPFAGAIRSKKLSSTLCASTNLKRVSANNWIGTILAIVLHYELRTPKSCRRPIRAVSSIAGGDFFLDRRSLPNGERAKRRFDRIFSERFR